MGTRIIGGAVGFSLLALLWSMLASRSMPARIPSLSQIYQATADNFLESAALAYHSFGSGGIWSNLLYTIQNVYLGVAIGLVIGYAIGLGMARGRLFARYATTPITVLGTIPVIALLPFLSLWFGTSRITTYGLVIFYTAVTMTGAVRLSAELAESRYGDYAVSLGISHSRMTWSVLFPATLPASWGVLRAALALGWGFQCIAEILGGRIGAGRLVRTFADATNTPAVLGVLLCVGVVAVISDAIVALAGRWLVRWNE
jgi:NitT/TauT family transport system permease protein